MLERLDEVTAHRQIALDVVITSVYLQGGNVKNRLGIGGSKRKRRIVPLPYQQTEGPGNGKFHTLFQNSMAHF